MMRGSLNTIAYGNSNDIYNVGGGDIEQFNRVVTGLNNGAS